MAHSDRSCKKSCKVPTEESWAKAKEEMHQRAERLPFSKKLQILNQLREGITKWRKPLKDSGVPNLPE